MHPLLFDTLPLYFVMWVCAVVTAVAAGAYRGARAGFPAGRSAVAIALLAVSVLTGSKLLYMAEAYWFPAVDYVPQAVRTSFHGFRIPGGILLLAATMPLVCGALKLPWRRFGDMIAPVVAFALVLVRLGCFMNGCCFGRVSDLPWTVRFPRDSWVHWYHTSHGWIPTSAQLSLPVHPLQLYFVLAALLTWVVLVRQQGTAVGVPLPPARRAEAYAGHGQLLLYALFFGSTALLEPLRQNSLTLNNLIVPIAAVTAAGILIGRMLISHSTDALVVRPTTRG